MKSKAIYSILLLSFLLACNSPQQIVQENDPLFHTTDPSRLYFQNTRSHQYNMITQKATLIDHYSLKSLKDNRPLYPVIANNWLSEEAYILLKSGTKIPFPWRIRHGEGTEETVLESNDSSRKRHYSFCMEIYKQIESGENLSILTDAGEWIPIWQNESEQKQFEATLRDYFRLIEKI